MADKRHSLSLDGLPGLPQMAPLTRLAEKLWEQPEVVALWLGGSFARGEADAYSDVDLRVALSQEVYEDWKKPDYNLLFGAEYTGSQTMQFGESTLHHLVLTDGTLFDLWMQSGSQPPPQDATLVLACRSDQFRQQLTEARLPADTGSSAPDPAAIRQMIVEFWIGSHKHRKVLGRGLDLMVTKGLEGERTALLRLWNVRATGTDCGTQRLTIHTLTRIIHAAEGLVGLHALEVIGAPLTNRAEIICAIELYRDEVARIGRELSQSLDFAYPDTLEETVRHCWQTFLENSQTR